MCVAAYKTLLGKFAPTKNRWFSVSATAARYGEFENRSLLLTILAAKGPSSGVEGDEPYRFDNSSQQHHCSKWPRARRLTKYGGSPLVALNEGSLAVPHGSIFVSLGQPDDTVVGYQLSLTSLETDTGAQGYETRYIGCIGQ